MLRIRKIDDIKNELTLKIKQKDYDLEINQNIDEKDINLILNSNIFPIGEIIDKLHELSIDTKCLYNLATLQTERLEIYEKDLTICIDKNQYCNSLDYNIEIESNLDKNHAIELLKQYGKIFKFEICDDYLVKSARAINTALEEKKFNKIEN
jgi:uncharacterized protein YjbK